MKRLALLLATVAIVGFLTSKGHASPLSATIDTSTIAGKTIFDVFFDTGPDPKASSWGLVFHGDVPINQEFAFGQQVNVNTGFLFSNLSNPTADSWFDVTTGMGNGLGITQTGPFLTVYNNLGFTSTEGYESDSVTLDDPNADSDSGAGTGVSDDGTGLMAGSYGVPTNGTVSGLRRIAHIVLDGTTTLFVEGSVAIGTQSIDIDEQFPAAEEVIPEPRTLTLLALGGVALIVGRSRWRRRTKS